VRVPENMAPIIPEILAPLEEGQDGDSIASMAATS